MSKDQVTLVPAFMLLPAFWAGFYDGINPCNFALALIMLILLSRAGYTALHVLFYGILFIAASGIVHFGVTTGALDRLVSAPVVKGVVIVLYAVMGGLFILLGVWNIADRLRYAKHPDMSRFKCPPPVFLEKLNSRLWAHTFENSVRLIIFALIAVASGTVMTVGNAFFPQREYIFIVHSYYSAGGDPLFAKYSFLQYSFALLAPLIAVWLIVLLLGFLPKRTGVTLYYKSIVSALFLSVGIGLLVFLVSSLL